MTAVIYNTCITVIQRYCIAFTYLHNNCIEPRHVMRKQIATKTITTRISVYPSVNHAMFTVYYLTNMFDIHFFNMFHSPSLHTQGKIKPVDYYVMSDIM